MTELLNDPMEDEEQENLVGQVFQEKIDALERNRHMKIRDGSAAKNRLVRTALKASQRQPNIGHR